MFILGSRSILFFFSNLVYCQTNDRLVLMFSHQTGCVPHIQNHRGQHSVFRWTDNHDTRDVKLLQNNQQPPFSVMRAALTSHWYNMSHNFNKWHCYQLVWAKPAAKIQVSRNTDGSIQTIFLEVKWIPACDTEVIFSISSPTEAENTHRFQESRYKHEPRGGNQHNVELR